MDGNMARRCYAIIEDNLEDLTKMSTAQYAKKYNINYKVLCYYLKTHDVPHLRYGHINGSQTGDSTLQIVELLKEGTLSYGQIAAKFGITRQRVGAIADKHSLNKTQYERRVEMIKALPNVEKMNAAQIAKELNLSYNTVSKILREEEISHAHWQRSVLPPDVYDAMLQDLREKKLSRNKIAEKYNVSINWLRKVYRTEIEPELNTEDVL